MIRFKTYSLFLFMFTFSVFGQDTTQYRTQKGESLRKIAKKFDVGYRKLLKANPNISRRPKENTLILIPSATKPFDGELDDTVRYPVDLLPANKEDLIKASLKTLKDPIKQPAKKTDTVHMVLPKETLYSLSKLYDVSMVQLIKKNPVLSKEGLKIGQTLIVPVKKRAVLNASKNHIVQPKETWYAISKLYNVSINKLKAVNKISAIEGLKNGSVIEIPASFVPQNQKEDKNTHVVLKGETLYGISKKYGISIPELLAVNKDVFVDSLQVGAALKLPKKVVEISVKSTTRPVYKQNPIIHQHHVSENLTDVLRTYHVTKDSLIAINPSFDSIMQKGGDLLIGFDKKPFLFENKDAFKDSIITDKTITALLMLPFDFEKNDTLSQETLFANKHGLPTIVSDFYLGAKLAIDSLKNQGVAIDLKLVDTEKSVTVVQNKMAFLKAMHPDVVIGPLYSNIAMYVANEMPKTPIYYPIYSTKQSKFTSKNIIRTATQKKLLAQGILNYIKENRKGERLLIVGMQENMAKLKHLKAILSKTDSLGVVLQEDVSLLSPLDGYISQEHFLEKIKLEQPNWVLIAENNNVLTADVFNNIRNLPKDTVLDTSVKILSFEKSKYVAKIPYETLAKYQYTYATDEMEYEVLMNNDFEQAYLKQNYQYPSNYASRGFAVTYDAILRVLKGDAQDVYGASNRYKQLFLYLKNNQSINSNQAVFVNTIENSEKDGLKVVRLR